MDLCNHASVAAMAWRVAFALVTLFVTLTRATNLYLPESLTPIDCTGTTPTATCPVTVNPSDCYACLRTALDAAADGDHIILLGDHHESVSVTPFEPLVAIRKAILLTSANRARYVVAAGAWSSVLSLQHSDAHVSQIEFHAWRASQPAIVFEGGILRNTTVTSCRFVSGDVIGVATPIAITGTLQDSTVHHCHWHGASTISQMVINATSSVLERVDFSLNQWEPCALLPTLVGVHSGIVVSPYFVDDAELYAAPFARASDQTVGYASLFDAFVNHNEQDLVLRGITHEHLDDSLVVSRRLTVRAPVFPDVHSCFSTLVIHMATSGDYAFTVYNDLLQMSDLHVRFVRGADARGPAGLVVFRDATTRAASDDFIGHMRQNSLLSTAAYERLTSLPLVPTNESRPATIENLQRLFVSPPLDRVGHDPCGAIATHLRALDDWMAPNVVYTFFTKSDIVLSGNVFYASDVAVAMTSESGSSNGRLIVQRNWINSTFASIYASYYQRVSVELNVLVATTGATSTYYWIGSTSCPVTRCATTTHQGGNVLVNGVASQRVLVTATHPTGCMAPCDDVTVTEAAYWWTPTSQHGGDKVNANILGGTVNYCSELLFTHAVNASGLSLRPRNDRQRLVPDVTFAFYFAAAEANTTLLVSLSRASSDTLRCSEAVVVGQSDFKTPVGVASLNLIVTPLAGRTDLDSRKCDAIPWTIEVLVNKPGLFQIGAGANLLKVCPQMPTCSSTYDEASPMCSFEVAYARAASGATIEICDGAVIAWGDCKVLDKSVNVVGARHTTNQPRLTVVAPACCIFHVTAPGVTLSNLIFDSMLTQGGSALWIEGDRSTIQNCTFSNLYSGVVVDQQPHVSLHHNRFVNMSVGVTFNADYTTPMATCDTRYACSAEIANNTFESVHVGVNVGDVLPNEVLSHSCPHASADVTRASRAGAARFSVPVQVQANTFLGGYKVGTLMRHASSRSAAERHVVRDNMFGVASARGYSPHYDLSEFKASTTLATESRCVVIQTNNVIFKNNTLHVSGDVVGNSLTWAYNTHLHNASFYYTLHSHYEDEFYAAPAIYTTPTRFQNNNLCGGKEAVTVYFVTPTFDGAMQLTNPIVLLENRVPSEASFRAPDVSLFDDEGGNVACDGTPIVLTDYGFGHKVVLSPTPAAAPTPASPTPAPASPTPAPAPTPATPTPQLFPLGSLRMWLLVAAILVGLTVFIVLPFVLLARSVQGYSSEDVAEALLDDPEDDDEELAEADVRRQEQAYQPLPDSDINQTNQSLYEAFNDPDLDSESRSRPRIVVVPQNDSLRQRVTSQSGAGVGALLAQAMKSKR